MRLHICNFELGKMPLIAGVLTDADVLAFGADSLSPADLIELRIDMFDDISLDHIESIFRVAKDKFKKPIIATARDVQEGGLKEIKDRVGVYRAVIPFCDVIDVEISSEDLAEVKKLCSAHKKLLIGSYHNFEFTPDSEFFEEIVRKGKEFGFDIIKIAVTAKDKEDLTRLMLFNLRHKDEAMITIAMGEKGLPSRVFSPICGSLITYGYVNHPSAPGQLSASELMYIFRRLKVR